VDHLFAATGKPTNTAVGFNKKKKRGPELLSVVLYLGTDRASEMLPLRLIGKEEAKDLKGFLDDRGKFYDSGHDRILRDSVALPSINSYRQITHLESNFSILQKFSYKLETAGYDPYVRWYGRT